MNINFVPLLCRRHTLK